MVYSRPCNLIIRNSIPMNCLTSLGTWAQNPLSNAGPQKALLGSWENGDPEIVMMQTIVTARPTLFTEKRDQPLRGMMGAEVENRVLVDESKSATNAGLLITTNMHASNPEGLALGYPRWCSSHRVPVNHPVPV